MLISQPHDISIAVGFVHIITTSSSVLLFSGPGQSQDLKIAKHPTLCQGFFYRFFLQLENTFELNRLFYRKKQNTLVPPLGSIFLLQR